MAQSGLVTIVFTDLVASTERAEAAPATEGDRVRREHLAALEGAVTATGGQVVKTVGDGVMASYTSASDGLGGAVALQQAVARHNRTLEHPLLMRVGVSAGDASFEDGDWFGRPVVEAARLCAVADGGQVLTTELVRALAGNRTELDVRPAGERTLKGLPDPLAVCEVAWDLAPPDDLPPLPEPLQRALDSVLRLVGRDGEVDALLGAWKEAAAGARRLVLLSGEPGIGKTRLAAEVAALAHGEGGVVLWGGCAEDLGIPYEPFAEALGLLAHAWPLDEPVRRLGSLAGELGRLLPDLDRLLPGLDAPLRSDPESERARLFDAVSELLAELAEEHPVVLVLDDLHWAAKPTLLMLRHLLRAPRPTRLLVVGTYRDTDLDRRHPLAEMLADLRRDGEGVRLALTGLGAEGVEALMAAAAGHDMEPAGRELAVAVHRETEGNPFFIREVLLHLVETGAIVQQDGVWTAGPTAIGIPEGVREVIGRRLSHLPEETNEVLAAASVLGRSFDLGLLAALTGSTPAEVSEQLEPAEAANLLRPVDDRGASFEFAHALVRSTLYDELATSRRLRLHREAGRALEGSGGAERHLADVARHFAEAAALGEVDRAVDYGRRAGDQAMADLAFEEAAAHYERALGVLEVAEGDDAVVRCDLLTALGLALVHASDPEHRKVLRVAIEFARQLDDAERLADAVLALGYQFWTRLEFGVADEELRALLEDSLTALGPDGDVRRHVLLLAHLSWVMGWHPGLRERALALRDQSLREARAFGDPETLGDVLSAQFALIDTSDPTGPPRLQEELDELIALSEGLSDRHLASGLITRSVDRLARGDRVGAEDDLARAGAIVEHLRDPAFANRLAAVNAAVLLLSGRLAEAEDAIAANAAYAQAHDLQWITTLSSQYFRLRYEQGRLDELVPSLLERIEQTPHVAAWRIAVAGAYAQTDQPEEARPHLRALAEDDFAMVVPDNTWLFTMAGIARVAGMVGDLDIAARAYELASTHGGRLAWTGTSYEQPIDLSLGTAAAALGRFDDAEAHFRASLELSERAGAPTFVAVTRLHWAEMLLSRDPADPRGRELAEQALATATDLGLRRIERVATALLA